MMKRINSDKIENVIIRLFLVFAILMAAYLFTFSFVFSYQNIIFRYQEVFRVNENIPRNIIGVLAIASLLFVMSNGLSKIKKFDFKYIALAIGCLSSVISIIWIFICGALPGADAGNICNIASQINSGDYSSLAAGEYIGMWQQQLGIVSILRVLYMIFGDMNYNSFRILSALSIILLTYSGYKITSILSKGNRLAEAIYCVLSFFCLPMYFYIPHVYGEMISTALIVFCFWMIVDLLDNFNCVKAVLLFLAMFFAVMVRQNTLIAVVAMIGILTVKLLLTKRKSIIVIILIILISCISQSQLMNAIYGKHFPANAKPMPSLCWVAMGLNEDNNLAGWWNRESLLMYEESGWEPEIASDKAKDLIHERMSDYISHPSKMIHFYIKKVSSQWLAPMWQSIAMNNVIDDENASGIAKAIYYNESISNAIAWLMNVYQIIVYGLLLVYFIVCFKVPGKIDDYFIPITVFGGMLFSILWEAKTRYMFPYYLMIIILSAIGASHLVKIIIKKGNSKSVNK